jgi:phosphoserine phosphatase RsbU/P
MAERLEDQLRGRIEYLELIQSVAHRLNSTLDLTLLLEDIVGEVADTFGCNRSAVLLLDVSKNELELVAVRGWSTNVHPKGFRFTVGRDGLIGRTAQLGEVSYIADVRKEPAYIVSEESTRSELDIPLKVRGQIIGIFNTQHPEVDGFSASQRLALETVADHMATALDNARLFQKEKATKERLESDYAEARRIQRALLPQVPIQAGSFLVSAACRPMYAVGGDWFDVLRLGEDRLGIALGDVSGKGMPAALLMAACRSNLRHFAKAEENPCVVLGRLNDLLRTDFPQGNFVTMIYSVLDLATGDLSVASAGHPAPLIVIDGSAQVVAIDNGLPLGIANSLYPETRLHLEIQSSAVFYSDGVVEAESSSGQDFGIEGLQSCSWLSGVTPDNLLDQVESFVHPNLMSDDATVIIIRGISELKIP